MIQVRALCEKAKEILMDESNVQVLYTIMLFFFSCYQNISSRIFYMPFLCFSSVSIFCYLFRNASYEPFRTLESTEL
jgi:hypothetical protein